MLHTNTPNGERAFRAEHYDIQSIKAAIGREIARNVRVTEELETAYLALQKAKDDYSRAVQQQVTELLERM